MASDQLQDGIFRAAVARLMIFTTNSDAREEIFSCIFFIAANQTLQQKHRPCKTRKERNTPFF